MLKIIFLSAIRSLLKYRQMSLINITGLVLGLTSFLFVVQYVVFEFSFDSFFNKPENVYLINWKVTKQGETIYNGAKSPTGLYYAIKEEIPEAEANGCAYFEKCQVLFEDTYYANQDFLWVSEDFEKVFPLQMVSGVADYSRPRVGIISETAAKALFHDKDPIGKIMEVNGEMPIEITGVFKDLPSNTHLTASYFVSYKTWVEMGAMSDRAEWRWGGWWNYIRLKDGASPEKVLSKINGFVPTYMGHLADDNLEASFSVQPLKDLHFIRGLEGEMGATTNFSSLVNLIFIALFMMFIAWINYVNLSVAHAQTRSLQISMRKLVGASNLHIWYQSLAESLVLNFVALSISFILYLIFKNTIAGLFDIPLKQANIPSVYIFLVLIAAVSSGILFSGIYYGIGLTRLNFFSEEKKASTGKFKKGLVIVQMVLSIVFLISTVVVYKQISFMKNQDLGIELNGVVICTGPASLNPDPQKRQKYEAFKNEIQSLAGVESATFNLFVPGVEPSGLGHTEFHNPSEGIIPGVTFFENNADDGFLKTYEIKLLAGKNFDPKPEQNYNDIIINKTAMNLLGFKNPEDAVGRWIFRRGDDTTRYEIIGVAADFHNEGLQKPIYPIVWNNNYPREFGYFAVRVNTKNISETLKQLQSAWNRHYTKDKFDYVFADQQFNKQYESETRYSRFYIWLTLLSIGIASIGLFALILFYLMKREKEIGVRKVNGATIGQVMVMLNSEIAKWVAVSFVIAVPLAWFAMDKWLNHFAFKTTMNWWIFGLCGLTVFLIALLTVSYQSWKAATRNPIESLRYE